MEFKEGVALYAYEIIRESGEDVIYLNYLGAPFVPNLADSPEVMARTVEALIESPNVSRIVFVQQKNYNYDFEETSLLLEIAQLYVYLMKQERILSTEKLVTGCGQCLSSRYEQVSYLLDVLKQDPIFCYNEINRLLIEEKIVLERLPLQCKPCETNYIHLLERVLNMLKNTEIIRKAFPYVDKYKRNEREIYHLFFKPDIIPNFAFTRLVASLPKDAEIINQYSIAQGSYDESTVTILKIKNETKFFYHLIPPEYSLSEDFNMLLNLARTVLIEHQPKAEEFTDVDRARQVFFNISRDLVQDLAKNKNVRINYNELNKLATILVRHTIGFGLIEVLLQDKELQDIVLNSPIALNPVFIRHQEYDECITNILPSQGDADSWAAKFRMISGRPLDEANPVLDTQLNIGKINARVAIIQQPLSPGGLAYALRRHREEPWTLQLFIKNKMLNSFTAGLLSFLIDGSRTILVAGTRSAGKTSLLGSLMLEIIPRYRIIVVEDSVTGDAKIIIKEGDKFNKTTIGEFIDKQIEKNGFIDIDGRKKALNLDEIKVFSVNSEGKVVLAKPSIFIRHKVNKQIYEIETTSGKKIKVTEDHSLFTLDETKILKPTKSKEIRERDFIAVPLKLSFDNSLNEINLLEHTDKLNKKIFVLGEDLEKYIKKNRKNLFYLGYSLGYKKSTIQNWIKKKILPLKIFLKIKDNVNKNNLFIKSLGCSRKIPANLILDETFLSFVGLWLADGCYDKKSIIISVGEEENKDIVRKIANRFKIPIKIHSDTFSLMLNSSLLKEIMKNILELRGNSYTKEIPSWIYDVPDKQVGAFLKGFFSGNGCVSDKEIVFSICSKKLIDDITTLLLRFNIILRSSSLMRKDKTFNCRIGPTKMISRFKENIGFLVKSKQDKLEKLCLRISTHDIADVIPLSLEIKNELSEILGKKFNRQDYITRQNNLGREHLTSLLNLIPEKITNPVNSLKKIVKSDIFWDRVKSVRKINEQGYVYDISVPGSENFICENIIAHNTLELPVDSLRKLRYNILRMKVRSALLKTTTEVAAEEGIRTSLRLGDSCLIVGEVRSSISGDEEVVIIDNGFMRRIQIKDLENKDLRNVYVPTISFDLKVKLSKLTNFVKHPKRKKLLRIKTKTGREVTVTPDHSLFSPTKDFEIAPIECKNLKAGNQIVIPSHIPCGFNNINFINIFDYLPEFRVENFENYIREAIKILGWKKATEICNINTGDIYNYFRKNQKTNVPFESFKNLMKKAKIDYDINNLNVKKGTSLSIPAKIPVNEDFCRFLGYYVSEGYYSLKEKGGGNVVITNSNPEIMEDISNISKSLFKLSPKRRIVKSLGSSIQHQLHCLSLAKLISKLGCGRTCYEKRAPSIIFGLSKEKIAAFLKGLYSGDGCFTSSESSGNCVRYHSTSKKLVEDVSYLLLNFDIVARISEKKQNGMSRKPLWVLEFKDREMIKIFLSEIGFVRKIPKILIKKWAHTKSNFVEFDKEKLRKHLIKYPRKYRHLFRFLRCSKNYLKKVVLDSECKISKRLKTFALGDFFLDKIKEIEEIELDEEEYVYDLSVAPTENFIGGFGGILLHNTEAKALYEAMRVGALANVVAGTIHGADPYSVFDRVVNDLEVPITSFKATDLIVVANPIKSPDGLHSWKRVVQLSEVRKHWTKDPLEEKGFVDLLKYNVEKDELEPSDYLINGESEIIKSVASNVKGWAGDWDAVYDNILLRAKIKQELVDAAEKTGMDDLLEAKFNVLSNNVFHLISDEVRKEIGLPLSDRVFPQWQKWLRQEIKAKKVA